MSDKLLWICIILTLMTLFIAAPSKAQQQSTPEVEALSSRLLQEINNSVTCGTSAITLKREVDRLAAENAALKKQVPTVKKD